MIILLPTAIILSFLITLFCTRFVRGFALRKKFLAMPAPQRIHTTPTPLGGGVAIAIGIIVPLGLGVLAAYLHERFSLFDFLPHQILMHTGGVLNRAESLFIILCGGLVILVLGLADDKRDLSPATKLLVEGIVALGIVLSGQHLSLFLGSGLGKFVGAIITILWIVAVTNSFNLLDHMDGICSGVCLIVSVAFLLVAIQNGQLFIAAMVSVIIGATAAFLIFNFPPAKIFLGDAGSLFLGYMLATLTIVFTFYREIYPLYSYFVPIVVLSVPLFDTIAVILIRIKARRSIFSADKNHFAHRLLDLGLGPKSAVVIVYAVTFCAGLSGILLYQVKQLGAVVILVQVILIFVLINILEGSARRPAS